MIGQSNKAKKVHKNQSSTMQSNAVSLDQTFHLILSFFFIDPCAIISFLPSDVDSLQDITRSCRATPFQVK